MPESRLAALATSPLVQNFALDRSQKALKPSGIYVAPLCTVADIRVHYKIYDSLARFTIPDTTRQPGGKATQLGFGGKDQYVELEPNALDLPIPNIAGLADEAVQYQLMEGMGILADASALALEYEQLSKAVAGAGASWDLDWTAETDDLSTNDPIGDENYGLDQAVRSIMLAAPGTPIKILIGVGAMMDARNNTNIRSRIIVGASGGENVGLFSLTEAQLSALIFGNPKIQTSTMVRNTAAPGTVQAGRRTTAGMVAQLSFLLDHQVLVFAANDTPNRMDASFMKTFSPMAGFFKPGTYMTQDQRDEVAKMDWTTLPIVTNAPAGILINTKPA